MSAISHAANAARLDRLMLYDYKPGRAGMRVFITSDGRCAVSLIDAEGNEVRYMYRLDHAEVRRFESTLESCQYSGATTGTAEQHAHEQTPFIVVCFVSGVSHFVLGRDDPQSAWHVLWRGLNGLAQDLDPDSRVYSGPYQPNWMPVACP